jgi:hypothetical protein
MSTPKAMRTGLAALLIGLAAMGGVARGQATFLPGQVRSQALAGATFPTGCAHVGIVPVTRVGLDSTPEGRQYLGEAFLGQCRIELAPTVIAALVNQRYQGAFKHKAALLRRETAMISCTVIAHEYGHLAGLPHDPTNPHSVMYPELVYTWQPCRDLFPRY